MSKFIEFIREQGVIGLAIGFILGGAVTKVVTSLVEDIINPVISIIAGGRTESLATAILTIGKAEVHYGQFIGVLINFVIIAAVVYYVFKGLGLDKLDKKKEKK
ncbi:MscL family protein [Candidatus Roizmanbacteria bacterium]|nr:MAG: MscL family protein [Candidatus Roizmanbacteria bacterium]